MERGVASRGARLVTARLGRPRDPARRALGPGCEELAVTDPDASPVREARDRSPKSPRWSAERRASLAQGTQGASQAPGVPRQGTPTGCLARAPVRLSVLRPPLIAGERSEKQNPGAKRAAGTKRCCLVIRLSVGHSGRGAIAARAGIHNHWPWVWIPGSRALPAPRNDAQKTRRGNEIGCLMPSQASVRGLGCAPLREPFEARRPLA